MSLIDFRRADRSCICRSDCLQYHGHVPKRGSGATKATYDQKKGVRRLARERVGAVPPAKVIKPKVLRKKPKYRKPIDPEDV